MRKRTSTIIAIAIILSGMRYAWALTVPLAFGVTGDSNPNGNTVIYRDGNALSYIALPVNTTTQLSARTDPPGTLSLSSSTTFGLPLGLCASTAAAIGSYVYISTGNAASLGTLCK